MRILAVALNTFRECVRDKVLYVLLGFAAAAILGSKALGWISIGQDIKIVKDISLASISVFGVLIAIFTGANLVYKELDKRTLYTILCRPLHRFEFVLGKYLGLALLLLCATALMSAIMIAYVWALGGPIDAVFLSAIALMYVELLVLTAASTLLSTVASPLLAAVISFCVYAAGHATGILVDLPPQLKRTPAEGVMKFLYYAIPNLENFNLRTEAANGVLVQPSFVLWAATYGLVYSAMLLLLAIIAFEHKDV